MVETDKALENSSTLLGAEAGSLVIDGDPPDVFGQLGMQRDAAFRRRGVKRVGEQIEKYLPHALFLERDGSVALVREGEASSVVLGQRACILREALQEGGRCLFLHVDGDCLRIGARQEEQFVDNPVDARELLELHVHRFLLCRVEVAIDQQAFGVQAHERKRSLELVRSVGGESPYLGKRGFQAIEHLVEKAREARYFVFDVSDRNSLVQIVGANPVCGRLDYPHRP